MRKPYPWPVCMCLAVFALRVARCSKELEGPMRGMRHPLTHALYELCDEGVRVTDGNQIGVYDNDGRWVSGDRFLVCPNLCGWIGTGPREPSTLKDHRRFRNVVVKQATTKESGS